MTLPYQKEREAKAKLHKANVHKFVRDVQTNPALQQELIAYFNKHHAVIDIFVLEFALAKGYDVGLSSETESLTKLLEQEVRLLYILGDSPKQTQYYGYSEAEIAQLIKQFEQKQKELEVSESDLLPMLFINLSDLYVENVINAIDQLEANESGEWNR